MEPGQPLAATIVDETQKPPDQAADLTLYDRPGVLRERDVEIEILSEEHREHILAHIKRLNNAMSRPIPERFKPNNKILPVYAAREESQRKKAAQRQLARMSIVFRRMLWKHSQGELEPGDIESWMADLIDASYYDDRQNRKALFSVAAVMDPILNLGERQEMEILVQELIAGNDDDVIELHSVLQTDDDQTSLPDEDEVDLFSEDTGHRAGFRSDDNTVRRVKSKLPRPSFLDRMHSSQSLKSQAGEKLPDKLVEIKRSKTPDIRWPRRPSGPRRTQSMLC